MWYGMENSIIDSALSKWHMSVQACSQLKEEILSKYNYINNFLN